MSNIICTTGCNGSGKSTISEEILKNIKMEYTHFSNPKDMVDGKKQYYDFLDNIQNDKNDKNYLCDRYHCGEHVYAPIYRGYESDYLIDFENKVVKDNNFLFVYVTADLQKIIERIDVRGEDFMKQEHLGLERQLFDKFMFKTQHLPFVHVDTTNIPLQDNLKIILESYEKLNTIWNSMRNCLKCSNVVAPITLPRGNIQAKYFIVGQNPGGKGKNQNKHTPIFSNGKTSQFLINTLINAGIYQDSWLTNLVLCGTEDNKINENLVNNCQHNLKLQYDLIKPEKMFALGNETYKYLINECKYILKDCEIVLVEHPTYVKRFFSGKEEKIKEYVEKFKC